MPFLASGSRRRLDERQIIEILDHDFQFVTVPLTNGIDNVIVQLLPNFVSLFNALPNLVIDSSRLAQVLLKHLPLSVLVSSSHVCIQCA